VSIFTSLLGGPWLYVAAFVAGSAVGATGGYKVKDFTDSRQIARLNQDIAVGKADLANAETRYKTREAQIEQDRADTERKALEGIQAQAAVAAELRTKLADAEKRRSAASRALTAALTKAETDRASFPLSPAALAYLASVRAEQAHE
jgi:hypothetical protein